MLLEFGSFDVGDSATATRFLRPLALRLCWSSEVPKHGVVGWLYLSSSNKKQLHPIIVYTNRRKFTVKLPRIWTDEAAEVGTVREEKESEETPGQM